MMRPARGSSSRREVSVDSGSERAPGTRPARKSSSDRRSIGATRPRVLGIDGQHRAEARVVGARGQGKRESDDEQRHARDVFHGFATVTVTLPLPVAPALSRTVTTRVFVPFVPLVVTHGSVAGRSPLLSFQTCVPLAVIV